MNEKDTRTLSLAILGALSCDSSLIAELRAVLRTDFFEGDDAKWTWQAACTLDDEAQQATIATLPVTVEQISRGKVTAAEVTRLLLEAHDHCFISTEHAPTDARTLAKLRKKEAKKFAIIAAHDQALKGNPRAPDDLADRLRQIDDDFGADADAAIVDLKTLFEGVIDRASSPDKTTRLIVGLEALDGIAGGLEPGSMNVIAARPSVGKTTVGVEIARGFAKLGGKAGILSLEMNADSIGVMLLSAESSVPALAIIEGRAGSLIGKLGDAASNLMDAGIFLSAPSGAGLAGVRAALSRMKAKGAQIVIVDYLQLIAGDSGASEYEKVTATSAMLKREARRLDLRVVVLAQLGRAVDKDGREPLLSDLKNSGAIEQDADLVALLHRVDEPGADGLHRVKFHIAKNRNGPTGSRIIRIDQTRRKVLEDNGPRIVPAYGPGPRPEAEARSHE